MGTTRYSVQAGEMSCAHTAASELLCRWVTPATDTALKSRNQQAQAFFTGHQPQPVAIIGAIVFIHESNKAESVLKAFTARLRAHE